MTKWWRRPDVADYAETMREQNAMSNAPLSRAYFESQMSIYDYVAKLEDDRADLLEALKLVWISIDANHPAAVMVQDVLAKVEARS